MKLNRILLCILGSGSLSQAYIDPRSYDEVSLLSVYFLLDHYFYLLMSLFKNKEVSNASSDTERKMLLRHHILPNLPFRNDSEELKDALKHWCASIPPSTSPHPCQSPTYQILLKGLDESLHSSPPLSLPLSIYLESLILPLRNNPFPHPEDIRSACQGMEKALTYAIILKHLPTENQKAILTLCEPYLSSPTSGPHSFPLPPPLPSSLFSPPLPPSTNPLTFPLQSLKESVEQSITILLSNVSIDTPRLLAQGEALLAQLHTLSLSYPSIEGDQQEEREQSLFSQALTDISSSIELFHQTVEALTNQQPKIPFPQDFPLPLKEALSTFSLLISEQEPSPPLPRRLLNTPTIPNSLNGNDQFSSQPVNEEAPGGISNDTTAAEDIDENSIREGRGDNRQLFRGIPQVNNNAFSSPFPSLMYPPLNNPNSMRESPFPSLFQQTFPTPYSQGVSSNHMNYSPGASVNPFNYFGNPSPTPTNTFSTPSNFIRGSANQNYFRNPPTAPINPFSAPNDNIFGNSLSTLRNPLTVPNNMYVPSNNNLFRNSINAPTYPRTATNAFTTMNPFTATNPSTITTTPFTATTMPFTGTMTPLTATMMPSTTPSMPYTATMMPFTATMTPFTATTMPFSSNGMAPSIEPSQEYANDATEREDRYRLDKIGAYAQEVGEKVKALLEPFKSAVPSMGNTVPSYLYSPLCNAIQEAAEIVNTAQNAFEATTGKRMRKFLTFNSSKDQPPIELHPLSLPQRRDERGRAYLTNPVESYVYVLARLVDYQMNVKHYLSKQALPRTASQTGPLTTEERGTKQEEEEGTRPGRERRRKEARPVQVKTESVTESQSNPHRVLARPQPINKRKITEEQKRKVKALKKNKEDKDFIQGLIKKSKNNISGGLNAPLFKKYRNQANSEAKKKKKEKDLGEKEKDLREKEKRIRSLRLADELLQELDYLDRCLRTLGEGEYTLEETMAMLEEFSDQERNFINEAPIRRKTGSRPKRLKYMKGPLPGYTEEEWKAFTPLKRKALKKKFKSDELKRKRAEEKKKREEEAQGLLVTQEGDDKEESVGIYEESGSEEGEVSGSEEGKESGSEEREVSGSEEREESGSEEGEVSEESEYSEEIEYRERSEDREENEDRKSEQSEDREEFSHDNSPYKKLKRD